MKSQSLALSTYHCQFEFSKKGKGKEAREYLLLQTFHNGTTIPIPLLVEVNEFFAVDRTWARESVISGELFLIEIWKWNLWHGTQRRYLRYLYLGSMTVYACYAGKWVENRMRAFSPSPLGIPSHARHSIDGYLWIFLLTPDLVRELSERERNLLGLSLSLSLFLGSLVLVV